MIQSGLKLEQAPPIAVPFQFFLAAPVFLLLASGALLYSGADAFAARVSPDALAITHLYAIGFMTMAMIGAMMQMLPVLQGSPVPRPRLTALLTYVGVGAGTITFAAGFLFGVQRLLQSGAVLLVAGFAAFLVAVLVCLARAPSRSHTVRAMWLAVAALAITVACGAMLALLFGWGIRPYSGAIGALHPGWALLGWTGLLVVGVGFELVPMLQITPLYPKPMTRYLGAVIVALLVLWSVRLWLHPGEADAIATVCALALAACYIAFALVTVVLQQRRRRRVRDVTLDFWRIGMASLAGASLAWGARAVAIGPWPESMDIFIGILALFGFAGSVISGMLYKIMPFLAWFHLQSTCSPGTLAPNMKKILPDARQRRQFYAQMLALALMCAAALRPALFVYPAALALGAAALMLEWNMITIVRVYRDHLRQAGARKA